jgi:hypothetical protein
MGVIESTRTDRVVVVLDPPIMSSSFAICSGTCGVKLSEAHRRNGWPWERLSKANCQSDRRHPGIGFERSRKRRWRRACRGAIEPTAANVINIPPENKSEDDQNFRQDPVFRRNSGTCEEKFESRSLRQPPLTLVSEQSAECQPPGTGPLISHIPDPTVPGRRPIRHPRS